MATLRRFRIFFSYNINTKILFLEAFLLLGWARIQRDRHFPKVIQTMGLKAEETSFDQSLLTIRTIKEISDVIRVISRYTSWDSNCLVRGFAVVKMLERRKIDSTLYLGTAKNDTGSLVAHAWVRSGTFFVTGYDEMNKFTVVGKFAKKISHEYEGEKDEQS